MLSSELKSLLDKKEKDNVNVIVNDFKQMYNRLKDVLPINGEEEFVKKFDLTGHIERVMEQVIDSGGKMNVTVLGEVISGKSTVEMWLVDKGNEMLKKKKLLFKDHIKNIEHKKDVREFDNYKMVVGDQIEFISIIKKKLWNCFIGIDEFNKLGETGANSSIEAILYQTYSDIFAQQRIHVINCSPSIVNDSNCWLILEVIGKDLKKKITRVKVVYRDVISGRTLAIGRADIPVGEVIEKKWCKRYVEKKFKRMGLVQDHGVRKISELETARIIISIYEKLKKRARTLKVNSDVILNNSKIAIKKFGYICSMVAEGDITSYSRGLLANEYEIGKSLEMIRNEKAKKRPNKEKIKALTEAIEDDTKSLEEMIEFQIKMNKLYEEYLNIN